MKATHPYHKNQQFNIYSSSQFTFPYTIQDSHIINGWLNVPYLLENHWQSARSYTLVYLYHQGYWKVLDFNQEILKLIIKHNDYVHLNANWHLSMKYVYHVTKKWYCHKPKSVIDNEQAKLLWDLQIQSNHKLEYMKPDITVVNNVYRKMTLHAEENKIIWKKKKNS